MIRLVRELYQYRGLLLSLVQRELKARYRGSFLGFLWTFLNPMLHMMVYALLFTVVMRNNTPNYAYFMFVGLLPWIWFSSSIGGGASAISDRRDLMTKVRFPAQVLPTTVVVTNLCNYVLSLPLMFLMGALYGQWPTWHIIAFPAVVLIQLCFTTALTYILAAVNVTFRDLQHIVMNLMTLWFFATPVLFQLSTIHSERMRMLVGLVNPMSIIITSYQAMFYEHRLPDGEPLLILAVCSVALLWASSSIFEARREEFAESI
ncbi:ABC transporter permease [Corallococcus sp. H22C18031201]|uniref:ABC transporter permease n=1 Tax=Citreicoccus inhibens TaxID=2849499 RepID=UPI000E731651|nr:ABC transporter permease [Citreicoccus inhibens]MBU8896547.1 ABC transporter permease [Citreicoccus inhibens]RJS18743.1 ABC transporter permease [Corallococcus sp. H22C18031201]